MRKIGLAACAWFISFGLVGADDNVNDDSVNKERLDRWVAYYTDVARGYDVRLKSVPDQPLAVSSEPILVYSNPTIGFDTHGAFFVWTRKGRAEAIAAIWSKKIDASTTSEKNVNHEFHSLAMEPLVAKGEDGVEWTPAVPGIELKPVPDAPLPAETRGLRLAQMRAISRQFAGFDLNPREAGGEEVERQLRVLPKPLYRYLEPDPETTDSAGVQSNTDGAVFGLFLDWDPEILLLIETRPTPDGPRWHYGVAYVDYKPLRLQLNGKDVWSKPEKNFGESDGRYYCVIGVTTKPPELE